MINYYLGLIFGINYGIIEDKYLPVINWRFNLGLILIN